MKFKSKKTNKTNIVETVDGSDYLLTNKVYEVCEFLEKNGEWELSENISDCWNPQLGIKNKSELLRTIGEYLKNNWDRRANTVTPIISKLRELYTTIENADFNRPMTSYNESKEMHLRYHSNNQKYFTPQQAEKMGYFRPEYIDGSKPYEQWFNAKGQRIYVQRIDPFSDFRKNTGKSGFRMHESKTNKNVVKISENTLRQIVAESVKKVLKEGQMGFSRDADSYGEELRSRELNGVKPQRDEMREHSRKILMGIYDDLHTWETYAMGNSNGIDKQSAFDAYRAAMEAIETLGKAFYGDEFWGN